MPRAIQVGSRASQEPAVGSEAGPIRDSARGTVPARLGLKTVLAGRIKDQLARADETKAVSRVSSSPPSHPRWRTCVWTSTYAASSARCPRRTLG